MFKVKKFQSSVNKETSEPKETYVIRIIFKMLKDEGVYILIVFEFLELEDKTCQLNIGNYDTSLKVHVIRNKIDSY